MHQDTHTMVIDYAGNVILHTKGDITKELTNNSIGFDFCESLDGNIMVLLAAWSDQNFKDWLTMKILAGT